LRNRRSDRIGYAASPTSASAPPPQAAPPAAPPTQTYTRRVGETGHIVAGTNPHTSSRHRAISLRSGSVSSWHVLLLSTA
jgi:hypothetical protein